MKIQTKTTGIRSWYGDDLLELQSEPFKVMDGFFSEFGNCVLSGCEITTNGSRFDVSPGVVALLGTDHDGQEVFRVAYFPGITQQALPLYLVLKCETLPGVYLDNSSKAKAYDYTAEARSVKPSGGLYIEISETGTPRFSDMLKLSAPPSSTYDYIVDSDTALAALSGNTEVQHVLVRKGRWKTSSPITICPNVKNIEGENGAEILFIPVEGGPKGTEEAPVFAIGRQNGVPPEAYDIKIKNLRLEVESVAEELTLAGFWGLNNISDTTVAIKTYGEVTKVHSVRGFHSCWDLTACRCHLIADYGRSTVTCQPAGFYGCRRLNDCSSVFELVPEQDTGFRGEGAGYRNCDFVYGSTYELITHAPTLAETWFYGMIHCHMVYNCKINSGSNTVGFMGLHLCINVTGTEVVIGQSTGGYVTSFHHCCHLSKCVSRITEGAGDRGSTRMAAYTLCRDVVECLSYHSAPDMLAFYDCECVSRCAANGRYLDSLSTVKEPKYFEPVLCSFDIYGGYNYEGPEMEEWFEIIEEI